MENEAGETEKRITEYDTIGPWSEIKLEIVSRYATEYSKVITAQIKRGRRFHHAYIDAFAGPGVHLSRVSQEFVQGSPLNALIVEPPFREFFFIDLDGSKVEQLKNLIGQRQDVHIYQGDCNEVLLAQVFPRVQYEDYRRALCLLDPYGLHLDWRVIQVAGEMRSIEIFLNFPVMDMNRNVLWSLPDQVPAEQRRRMTRFWGDDSWYEVVYKESPQMTLFGGPFYEKTGHRKIVEAFRRRLKEKAGFVYVPEPIPMRNTKGSVLYYLFFASHNKTGKVIIEYIFNKFRGMIPELPKRESGQS
ncbi:MAG TPA: three-Cys-motif partner protein TcmP [Firmicutes bacterium]|nr:three-Cys-motif partner protein TcmP [Candidatus Fermentithermobacillaceae bacterium]